MHATSDQVWYEEQDAKPTTERTFAGAKRIVDLGYGEVASDADPGEDLDGAGRVLLDRLVW